MTEFCHGMGQSDEPKKSGIERLEIVKDGCCRDMAECNCICHRDTDASFPGHGCSCQKCPQCRKNIRNEWREAHQKICVENQSEPS